MTDMPELPAETVIELSPTLRVIRADNPSPMTERGTNTYVVGRCDLAVIDPGPALPQHLAALRAAIGSVPLRAILVTHSHRDHSELAPALADLTGAPVLAYGASEAGRRPELLALTQGLGGGEGVDRGFRPDRCLRDGERIDGADWAITALWTPGHMANHLSFAFEDALFSGDLVMGWSTSLVSPPDGDLAAFMTSCRHLQTRQDRRYYPGHGAAVEDPAARLTELIAHREARTIQLRAALAAGPATATALTRRVYTEISDALLPAAERNLLAHLIALFEQEEVSAQAPWGPETLFALAR